MCASALSVPIQARHAIEFRMVTVRPYAQQSKKHVVLCTHVEFHMASHIQFMWNMEFHMELHMESHMDVHMDVYMGG